MSIRPQGPQHSVAANHYTTTYKRPFWLPAISYYFLTVATVLVIFFIVWWFLKEPQGGTPWIPAGIISSLLLIGAVLLREIYLRNAMIRYIAVKRRLDDNLTRAAASVPSIKAKFTLRQNEAFLSEIRRKSNAARTLEGLPDAHLEVFEMCEEYLGLTEKELKSVGVGSPRFGAIRNGRRKAREYHRYHLLGWASIESRLYTQEAQNCGTILAKIENAEKALNVLNTALHFYPRDVRLLESVDVVKELIASAEISHRISAAERLAERGDHGAAIGNYKDALYYLAREEIEGKETKKLARKISKEVDRLRELADGSSRK